MNDRERWIVYPLLFLALGAALRDKLAKQTSAKQIVCEELYLVDAEGRPRGKLTGERLVFDGRGNGLVVANAINAEAYFQNDRPLAEVTGQLLVKPFLQFFTQLGSSRQASPGRKLRLVPRSQPPNQPAPPAQPDAEGPQLTPPARGDGEPGGAA